ncbi:MAG: GTPase [Gemmataceae bacterium]
MKFSAWRLLVIGLLLATPVLTLCGFGSWYLWQQGLSLWLWWPMMAAMFLGWYLAWYWQSSRSLLLPPEIEVEPHFTARDEQAANLVEARARQSVREQSEQLTNPDFYIQSARELADELARFYNPKATDAVDRLTVPEILAAVELAAEDLADLVSKYAPGGHLLTVGDLKNAAKLASYYDTGMAAYWGILAVFDPINTALKYAASQAGASLPMRLLQRHLTGWFYEAFLTRLGKYLIEVNSGRLRVGARRYRELRAQMQLTNQAPTGQLTDPADAVGSVTVTLLGQVQAGKSSLVNALLGEQRAGVSVTPSAEGARRYEVQTPGIPTRLILFDTHGYAHEGPGADLVEQTLQLAQQSDLLLLVLPARNPARQADLLLLQKLSAYFAARPDLKAPPIVGVMTQVDLLSPATEWSPPYDWLRGQRPKEQNIRQAVQAVQEQLGTYLEAIVPVNTAAGRLFGIEDGLLPVLAFQLNEARGVAFLRTLKAEADRDKIRRAFQQTWELGKQTAKNVWQLLTR